MDMEFKRRFTELWDRYFPGADLPIVFYYADAPADSTLVEAPSAWRCMLADLGRVRRGKSVCFNLDSIGCPGGQRYTGFSQEVSDAFRYFLSCGIEGKIEGERYKKSPELVDQYMTDRCPFEAPAPYIVFKRWDELCADDEPAVVIFFATGDVLSGLFTLANFDTPHQQAVISPFCSGCGSIIDIPLHEIQSDDQKAVLGMFDISARPYVEPNTLTFAAPFEKFARMVDNMEASFLITKSWSKVKNRIQAGG